MPPQSRAVVSGQVAGDLALHPLDDIRFRTFLSVYDWTVSFQKRNTIF